MADWLTREQRSRNMAAIRSRATSPERKLGDMLATLLPRHRVVEHPGDLPGRPDYFIPGLRLAIFMDGCFWHGCPHHGRQPESNEHYWTPKLARNRARDRARRRRLRALGLSVWTVWEHDMKNRNLDVTRRRLDSRIRKRRDLMQVPSR